MTTTDSFRSLAALRNELTKSVSLISIDEGFYVSRSVFARAGVVSRLVALSTVLLGPRGVRGLGLLHRLRHLLGLLLVLHAHFPDPFLNFASICDSASSITFACVG